MILIVNYNIKHETVRETSKQQQVTCDVIAGETKTLPIKYLQRQLVFVNAMQCIHTNTGTYANTEPTSLLVAAVVAVDVR
jgi:hypothetical protein